MKRNRLISLIIIVLLSMVPVSCVMYHPHNVDIPLLEEKGDLHIDASANMTFPLLDGTGLNGTVSWAPFNMVGLQAAGSISDNKNYQVQAAAGTFHPFGKSVLECYLGAAAGHSNYDNKSNNNTVSHRVGGPYNILFGQINFGWNHLADDLIDVGVGFKAGILNPDWKRETLNNTTNEWDLDLTHTDPHFLVEPLLMFRIGGEHLKFNINIAYSWLNGWPTENNYINYTRLSVALGMHYKF
ncbi:MAG: hypothetical protein J6X86_07210 [Bacteroidales bacterium]|nr:hypothetical protein [Bacteroidales bacterium]